MDLGLERTPMKQQDQVAVREIHHDRMIAGVLNRLRWYYVFLAGRVGAMA